MFLLLAVILTACNTKMTIINTFDTEIQPPTTYKHSPKPYVKGIEDIDVIEAHYIIYGYEEIENFYHDVNADKPSKLRLVSYGFDSGPHVQDITYNGNNIKIIEDGTRNMEGGDLTTITCGKLVKEMNPTNITYFAVDCNGYFNGIVRLAGINYDMKKQDSFEFYLKYGSKFENDIDSERNYAMKKGKMKEINITEKIKQEVYKKLIFANYFEDKEFYTACNAQKIDYYHLTIYINGGERFFYWNSCDKGFDALNFTEIAKYIIEQTNQTHEETSELTVQGYIIQVNEDSLVIGENLNILEYKQIQQGIQDGTLDAYLYDFLELQDINTKKFKAGDKIQATIGGEITEGKPSIAKVKKIELIEKPILE